ncbi:hypothetical protein IV454_06865 [Massilia antarctica]|uniref:Lipoprotein n=1 Tax=Massilia antarctica TaxID=2765360 RepID=A0AA49A9H4_9BURK|nr:hypothetical protein [Massilia antarctica]QPI51241.1 hypothetical protein IV454_06865 [Massilia antarctica]
MMRLISRTMLLVALGGCGGDDKPPPAAPQALPLAAAAPVPEPVRPAPAPPSAPARAAPPPSAPPPNDIAQLRQEVASLRREVADLRMLLTRAPMAAAPAPLAAPQVAETSTVAPSETMFRAEQTDPAWSTYATSAVRAALARANAGLESQVRRLECRTKTCRVEINPTSADLLESSMAAVLANVAAAIPNMTATQVGSDDGSEATVLYLTR